MAQAKVIAFSLLCAAAVSCAPEMTWTKHKVDGHITGVTAPNADNAAQALGVIDAESYTSPSGRVFRPGSATYAVAEDIIAVQPQMAHLKQVIAHSSREMIKNGANCELTNWIVDHLREDVAKITGRTVDVAIINSGGIRVDMPAGDVIMDDIVSMFPFKNYLCYVALTGKDLEAMLHEMVSVRSVMPMSGVKLVLTGKKIDSILVGGKPIDPDKIYGIGTIDFLLDGGDKMNVAKNAKELIITETMVIDSMLPYVMSYKEQGKSIEYFVDDRLVRNKVEE